MEHSPEKMLEVLDEIGIDNPKSYLYFSIIKKLRSDYGPEAVEEFKSLYLEDV